MDMRAPANTKELDFFLERINFLSKFMPELAEETDLFFATVEER
jgi:hypothetical protein